MTDRPLHVIVLAAGAGTRMHSALPKVLHEVGGIPMLGHVLSSALRVATGTTVVVLRHAIDQVQPYVERVAPTAIIARQDEIPGTGRAVECGLGALEDDGDVVVVSGDVPLLDAAQLDSLIAAHRSVGATATVLTALVPDPTGYGRIIRDESTGAVMRIVEDKDARAGEAAVREVNTGTYVFDLGALRDALARVGTANAQGEKYLTDVIALWAGAEDSAVQACVADDPWSVHGVNDPRQLAAVEAEYRRRAAASS